MSSVLTLLSLTAVGAKIPSPALEALGLGGATTIWVCVGDEARVHLGPGLFLNEGVVTPPSFTEGISVKMFLRGRPITMYIPSGIRSLEELPSGLPPETLSLDWVYPSWVPQLPPGHEGIEALHPHPHPHKPQSSHLPCMPLGPFP